MCRYGVAIYLKYHCILEIEMLCDHANTTLCCARCAQPNINLRIEYWHTMDMHDIIEMISKRLSINAQIIICL